MRRSETQILSTQIRVPMEIVRYQSSRILSELSWKSVS